VTKISEEILSCWKQNKQVNRETKKKLGKVTVRSNSILLSAPKTGVHVKQTKNYENVQDKNQFLDLEKILNGSDHLRFPI